ncbi:GGDEF domain-containing protein [Roseateles sp.]|uniref:GGDEF domain-containing protein n=1 Tax=Roseateles sp. TaxID=1971397 RepID=UPI003BA6583D
MQAPSSLLPQDPSVAPSSPAALQRDIDLLEALPHRSSQQLVRLAHDYEALSALAEQAGDWANALRHYQQFHRLSLLALAPELLTRDQLGDQLAAWLQEPTRLGSDFCLVALSVDAHSTSTPEQTLARLSALLRLQCRPDDLLAQCGRGDGLLLALPDVDLPSARKVCERVRCAWVSQQLGSLSMGLSAWRGPIDEPKRLIERAESGLAAAKQSGGNCLRSGTT